MLQDNKCPVCLEVGQKIIPRGALDEYYDCQCIRCGDFTISDLARMDLLNSENEIHENQRANMSGWLREQSGFRVNRENLPEIQKLNGPSVIEKAQKLLKAIDRKCTAIGQQIPIKFEDKSWWSVCWSPNGVEVSYLLNDYLTVSEGLLIGKSNGSVGMYKISPVGYTNLQQLREANTRKAHEDSQIGFCAMWFDDTVKNAWSEAISKAMGQAGYKPMRIDEHQHNNKIDDEISAMIRRSRFVVADFTGQRGGVYFEAGFALGLGVPVIWTCRKDDLNNVHFDNRQYNFLLWMPEELERFKCDLQNRIEQTLGKGKYVGAS